LLEQLAWKPALDDTDQLALTYFLLLQDRTGEAIVRFAGIDPAKLPARLNYDYLHAVVLFPQPYRHRPRHPQTPRPVGHPPG